MQKLSLTLQVVIVVLFAACGGGGKQDIPVSSDQTYQLQSSGKLTVYPSASTEGASGSEPLKHLRVKRKNEGAGAKQAGCFHCTDCICNDGDCSCTECTSC